jgi:hypothetical protein
MDYEDTLRALKEVTLAELKGPGGLLAVTEEDLIFIDDSGVQRLGLASIKRITRGEGGKVAVLGEEGGLEIPLRAFPVDELRLFMEGLRTHVARAKRRTVPPAPEAPRPQEGAVAEPPPPPPPPPAEPSRPSPKEEPRLEARGPVWEEEAPPAPKPPAQERRQGNPLALLSRLLALLSLAYGLGFALLNPVDLWVQLGVVLASLNFSVLLWSSGSSRSS